MWNCLKVLLSTVVALGLACGSAWAGPVEWKFPVKAQTTLSAGKRYVFTFRLFNVPSGGPELWREAKRLVVASDKSISHVVGSVKPLSAGTGGPVDFTQQLWLQVSGGGKSFPRLKLTAVPYALSAGALAADSVTNTTIADGAVDDAKIAGTISAAKIQQGNGTLLDADLLDGQQGAFYQDAGNVNAGTLSADRYSAYADLSAEGYLGDAAGDVAQNNGVLQPDLYAERAQTALGLSANAQAALDLRYGLAPAGQGVAGFWNLSTVDSAGWVGWYTSIAIGADGLPIVSYYDYANGDLKALHCGNATCSAGNTAVTVDSDGVVGYSTSITIGADGLPIISYEDYSNRDLKVLRCGNGSCSAGNTPVTVDGGGNVGWASSITIGADGLPIISYYDSINCDLKVLHCGNATCSAGNAPITVDSTGDVGYSTSIAIGADGLPIISYYDATNGDLKVLHCGNATCSAGNAPITVDSAGSVGWYTSIAIGADGLPVISYWDATNLDPKVLHCGTATCSAGNTPVTVDSAGDVGQYASIAIGADGLPIISYSDYTNDDLKVAHLFSRLLGRR